MLTQKQRCHIMRLGSGNRDRASRNLIGRKVRCGQVTGPLETATKHRGDLRAKRCSSRQRTELAEPKAVERPGTMNARAQGARGRTWLDSPQRINNGQANDVRAYAAPRVSLTYIIARTRRGSRSGADKTVATLSSKQGRISKHLTLVGCFEMKDKESRKGT